MWLGAITEDASVWILQFLWVFFQTVSLLNRCCTWLQFICLTPAVPRTATHLFHPLRHLYMLSSQSLHENKLYKFSYFEGDCRMFRFKGHIFGIFCFQRALVLSLLRWTYYSALIWLCNWTDLKRTGSVVQCIFLLPLPWSAISTLLITHLVFFKLHSLATHWLGGIIAGFQASVEV